MQGDKKFSLKCLRHCCMFLACILRGFQTNLIHFFRQKLTKNRKNNVLQLEYKYFKYFTKYEHL